MTAGDAAFGPAARRLAGLAGLSLGWPPAQFWNATPEELATVLEAALPQGEGPPDADALAALMEEHPDG